MTTWTKFGQLPRVDYTGRVCPASQQRPHQLSPTSPSAFHQLSASASFELLIKLLQRHTQRRIRFKLLIAPKSFRNTFVFIVENRRQRIKQVSCEDGSLALGQI